ncbi:hypothetical protein ACWEWD_20780 [Streptomyces tendae]
MQLDYAVATDLSGRARRHTDLTVTPAHLAGVDGGRFRSVALEGSYDDGATWHRAAPVGKGDGTRFRLDALAGARFATPRASAHDDAGNGVRQTATRAFGLK